MSNTGHECSCHVVFKVGPGCVVAVSRIASSSLYHADLFLDSYVALCMTIVLFRFNLSSHL